MQQNFSGICQHRIKLLKTRQSLSWSKNDIDINYIISSLNDESIQYNVTPDQVADIIADKMQWHSFKVDLRVDLEHLEIEVFI